MPETSTKMTIEQLLSKKDLLRLEELFSSFEYLESDIPFLTTIGVDSKRLGDAILQRCQELYPNHYTEIETGRFLKNPYPFFKKKYATLNQLILLPLYQANIDNVNSAGQQLLMHRDHINRDTLHLIFIIPKEGNLLRNLIFWMLRKS